MMSSTAIGHVARSALLALFSSVALLGQNSDYKIDRNLMQALTTMPKPSRRSSCSSGNERT